MKIANRKKKTKLKKSTYQIEYVKMELKNI